MQHTPFSQANSPDPPQQRSVLIAVDPDIQTTVDDIAQCAGFATSLVLIHNARTSLREKAHDLCVLGPFTDENKWDLIDVLRQMRTVAPRCKIICLLQRLQDNSMVMAYGAHDTVPMDLTSFPWLTILDHKLKLRKEMLAIIDPAPADRQEPAKGDPPVESMIIEEDGPTTVVKVCKVSWQKVLAGISRLRTRRDGRIVLDLADAEPMDAHGLMFLFRLFIIVKGGSGDIRLCSLSDDNHRILRSARMDSFLPVYVNREDALAPLAQA